MNSEPADYSFDQINIGQNATFEHTVSENDLHKFSEITGDYNPIHHDDIYAKKTMFGERIVQGLLTASFLSTLIGMFLPGKRSLYLSQEMKFVKPVYIGDTLTITGTVTEKEPDRNIVTVKTGINNQNGVAVLVGAAKVKIRNDNF